LLRFAALLEVVEESDAPALSNNQAGNSAVGATRKSAVISTGTFRVSAFARREPRARALGIR
jgi:hypothetical protein